MLCKTKSYDHSLFLTGLWLTAFSCLSLNRWQASADPSKRTQKDMEKALKHWRVIPDVIDEVPQLPLKIFYESGADPDFGNKLHPEDCATEPYMLEFNADEEKHYLLLMVDPDVPSHDNPVDGQYEHFILGNIHYGNLIRGTYISDYQAPHPLPNTGYHRYVFLLYLQPDEMEFEEKRLTWPEYGDIRRYNFSAKNYRAKYWLPPPLACNFFISEWEPPRNQTKKTTKSPKD